MQLTLSPQIDNHILPTEFINTKYACLRATPYEPNYNKRLICLLSLVEQSRELEGENIRAASYAHVISALKVKLCFFCFCFASCNVPL